MKPVLIDTCGWIDFFKSKTGRLGTQVANLIENDQATLTGVVIAELLQGIKTEKELQRLKHLFPITSLSKNNRRRLDTNRLLLQQLRTKGLTLPLTDILIATIAQRHAIAILTIDKHFQYLTVELYNDDQG